MIKAISFDFDDTLAGHFPPVHVAFHSILRLRGYKIKEETIVRSFLETMEQMKTTPEIVEKISRFALYTPEERKEFYTDINILRLEKLGLDGENIPLRELAGFITESFPEKTTKRLYDDVPETFLELKLFHEKVSVFIISGNRKKHIWKYLKTEGLETYIKAIFSPDNRKVMNKKHLFKYALSKTGIHPKQWLHVGDDFYTDYLYPSIMNMRTVLLHRPGILHLAIPDDKKGEIQMISELKQIYDFI